MTKKRTVFGAHPHGVRRFLDDCLTGGESQSPSGAPLDKGLLLREQLWEKCPLPRAAARSGSWLLDHANEKVLLDLTQSVGQVLSDDKADIEVLRDIKNRYKGWARKAASKDFQRVYTAIYFAAIARALVSHNRRISRYRNEYLVHSFETLAGEGWMIPALSELYRKARQTCG
jgi:hypothetical protein